MTTEPENRSDIPGGASDAPASIEPATEAAEPNVPANADASAAEVADLKDRLLRALAEQENFRRRAERERDEAVKFAAAGLIKDLLAAADNLSRALASVPAGTAVQDETLRDLLAGVAATERILHDAFAKHGIKKIEPSPGERFDPTHHQALSEVTDTDYPAGAVVETLLPGYAYHERLLRPALVGVSNGRGSPADSVAVE
jgi:molecular chaperone GrpE